jgi:tetratricopeptide (TPR) repeat protein
MGEQDGKSSLSEAPASTKSFLLKPRILCPAVVFAMALALYVWTLAPTVTLVDSGELILAAHTPGVAHPPGFPLYVLLSHLATLVPIGNVAERVNFASALFAAIAAGIVTLIAFEAMGAPEDSGKQGVKPAAKRRKRKGASQAADKTEKSVSSQSIAPFALACGLLFASSRTLWAYATIAEVYTLNTMLVTLIVFLMLRWRSLTIDERDKGGSGKHDRWLNAAALVFGLALGVHHVTVGLLLPALAILVFKVEGLGFFAGKRLWRAALFSFAGLAVYLYLPMAASRSPIMNWGDPRTFDRFISHVTGWQYRIFFEARPERIGQQISDFVRLALREFGPPWLPLILIFSLAGFIYLYRRSGALFWFLALTIGVNLAYNVNYEIAEDKDAYYLPVFLALVVSAGIGLRWAVGAAFTTVGQSWQLHSPRIATALGLALALLLPGLSLGSSFRFNDRGQYYVARDYLENILTTVEPGGMLLTLDWQVYSPMLYLREIEGFRHDAVVIDVNHLRRTWYFDYLERVYPEVMNASREQVDAFLEDLRRWEQDEDLYKRDLTLNRRISERFQNLILTLVANQMRSGSVYITQEIATYREGRESDWAEALSKKYQTVPQGLVFQLYGDREFHEPARPALLTRGLTDGSLSFADDDVVSIKVIPVYAGMLFNRGRYLALVNRHAEAIEAFKEALVFNPRFSAASVARAESELAVRKAAGL